MAGAHGREDIICEVFGNGGLRWTLSRVSYETFLSSCSVSPVTSDWASPLRGPTTHINTLRTKLPDFLLGEVKLFEKIV